MKHPPDSGVPDASLQFTPPFTDAEFAAKVALALTERAAQAVTQVKALAAATASSVATRAEAAKRTLNATVFGSLAEFSAASALAVEAQAVAAAIAVEMAAAAAATATHDAAAAAATAVEVAAAAARVSTELQASLQGKGLLLREVHHRVKNNLQVISSLLRLESSRSAQAETKNVLGEMQNRVRSISLLHESMHHPGSKATVDLGSYIRLLAAHLVKAHLISAGAIHVVMDVDELTVGMVQATTVGLLLNELVMNCLKHGFPDGGSGEIHIGLQRVGAGP